MIILINDREHIRTVAERWKTQYCRNSKWNKILLDKTAEQIYNELAALDVETATRYDVASIIGNDGWIGRVCSECEKSAVIIVGEAEDHDSSTVYLCLSCAKRVGELIRELDTNIES